ncbi:MAG: VTT domain-containing protein [Pyrinomonadaceae bacterium]
MIRNVSIFLWLSIIIGAISAYFIWPESFAPAAIVRLLTDFKGLALLVFTVFSMLRGLTLLPSTPLVIAGTLAFPGDPWIVLAISILGIIASSTMIYCFSDVLGFSEFFETRKPAAIAKIRGRLEQPAGLVLVFLWAFFPLVPTDAVCYVAGSSRMNFLKFIAAIAAGELILCSFYIFSGRYAVDLFK